MAAVIISLLNQYLFTGINTKFPKNSWSISKKIESEAYHSIEDILVVRYFLDPQKVNHLKRSKIASLSSKF